MNKIGLVDQIKRAETIKEIEALLKKGESYDQASDETVRRWHKVAAKRKKILEAQ